ncbi:MAG: 2,3-bisphosphoglycerate-independent phosphoglycerate mutase [Mollicutes bacterium]|nr:2,3-bisphosphoglycerate-independent phosphoglycerate mutase [Mollicutes bacterium]
MKKVLMIILDGFGIREEELGNAVKMANMPNFQRLLSEYPNTLLEASEEAVGLPKGQFGNSEIGHLTIGSGKVTKSKIKIINDSLASDELEQNKVFNDLVAHVKERDSALHLMGLVSDGGVHSHLDYFKQIIHILKLKEVKKVYFHVITDGRDTKVDSGINYVNELKSVLEENNVGEIVSLSGRYYAMDRDKKYDRTKLYYDVITGQKVVNAPDACKCIDACYEKEIFDEFIPPLLMNKEGVIKDNDGLFWLNFRPDRAVQILTSLTNPEFNEFPTVKYQNLKVITMFPTAESVKANYIFEDVSEGGLSLGKYFSELELTQARIAETEKYAHVTYYFDGGVDQRLKNAKYYLIPSPKVATYDQEPEMKAREITEQVIKCMEDDRDFILVNFANPDMVGHTGIISATIKALEVLDECLGKIVEEVENNFYTLFLLSDHGNADLMLDDVGNPVTTHSLSKVPFIITDKELKIKEGTLADVAPTILSYMDIAIPEEMKNSKVLITNKME